MMKYTLFAVLTFLFGCSKAHTTEPHIGEPDSGVLISDAGDMRPDGRADVADTAVPTDSRPDADIRRWFSSQISDCFSRPQDFRLYPVADHDFRKHGAITDMSLSTEGVLAVALEDGVITTWQLPSDTSDDIALDFREQAKVAVSQHIAWLDGHVIVGDDQHGVIRAWRPGDSVRTLDSRADQATVGLDIAERAKVVLHRERDGALFAQGVFGARFFDERILRASDFDVDEIADAKLIRATISSPSVAVVGVNREANGQAHLELSRLGLGRSGGAQKTHLFTQETPPAKGDVLLASDHTIDTFGVHNVVVATNHNDGARVDLVGRELLSTFKHEREISSLAFSDEEDLIAFTDDPGRLNLFVSDGRQVWDSTDLFEVVANVIYRDGRLFVSDKHRSARVSQLLCQTNDLSE